VRKPVSEVRLSKGQKLIQNNKMRYIERLLSDVVFHIQYTGNGNI